MPRATAVARKTSTKARQKAEILIVDDEASIREILKEKLSEAGYRCQVAGSADEAEKKAGKRIPDLALCDIRMPGRTGEDLLEWLVGNHPDTAVIMVTAVGDLSTAVGCLKTGASS